eukprot:TRINITY_DN2718_c3_g1_i1.p1 TRINITY_DN2718_c3_g1~~TRINITY_DN2718_c3_g1_i1.p1  ORF type:complete len:308 (+),score=131.07 TRINITY_DN2718_c3_g1_i1:80-1003(+)
MSSTEESNRFQKVFHTTDFYAILCVAKDASVDVIKKAYRKLALKWHPDRNGNDPSATERCQLLIKIWETLKDERKRTIYDRTGETEISDGQADWNEYWRSTYAEVGVEDIQEFAKSYIGSKAEMEDIEFAFKLACGTLDMDGQDHDGEGVEWDWKVVFGAVPLCETPEDEERIAKIVMEKVENGTWDKPALNWTSFVPMDAKAKKKAEKKRIKEAKEAEKALQEMRDQFGVKKSSSGNDDDDLRQLIQAKNASKSQGNDPFEALLAKYSDGAGKRKTVPDHEELNDLEFERIQREMMAKQDKKKRKK